MRPSLAQLVIRSTEDQGCTQSHLIGVLRSDGTVSPHPQRNTESCGMSRVCITTVQRDRTGDWKQGHHDHDHIIWLLVYHGYGIIQSVPVMIYLSYLRYGCTLCRNMSLFHHSSFPRSFSESCRTDNRIMWCRAKGWSGRARIAMHLTAWVVAWQITIYPLSLSGTEGLVLVVVSSSILSGIISCNSLFDLALSPFVACTFRKITVPHHESQTAFGNRFTPVEFDEGERSDHELFLLFFFHFFSLSIEAQIWEVWCHWAVPSRLTSGTGDRLQLQICKALLRRIITARYAQV